MKAFCPNCGTQNEGMAGGRLTCKACTASFEVPREEVGSVAPPPPVVQTIAPPPPSVVKPPPSQFPTGYNGPPPTGFSAGGAPGATNPLAIASLVLGILCCTPFSIAAIITGVMAQQQIKASGGQQKGSELATAGIILGGIGLTLGLVGIFFNLLKFVR